MQFTTLHESINTPAEELETFESEWVIDESNFDVKNEMKKFLARANVRSGGIFTSTFNLAVSAIGAGILGLPFAIKSAGLLNAIILTFILAFFSGYTCHILVWGASIKQTNNYQDTVEAFCGKITGHLSSLFLVGLLYGACVAYFIIMGESAVILKLLFNDKDFWFLDRRAMTAIFALCVVFPLTLLKRIKILGYSSFIALICATYTVGFVTVYGIIALQDETKGIDNSVQFFFNPSTQIITAFPLICFAFMCQFSVVPIFAELKNPSVLKMDLSIFLALTICIILDLSIAIFGYFQFGDGTKSNILNNYQIADIPASIGRICIGFVVTCGYPLLCFTSRLTFKSVFFPRLELEGWRFYVITFLWFGSSLGLSLLVDNIGVVLSLSGALGAATLIYIFPSMILFKIADYYDDTSKFKKYLFKVISILLIIFGLLVIILGTGVAVLDIVTESKWHDYVSDYFKRLNQ